MCGPYEERPISEVWNKFADYYNIKYQRTDVRPLNTWKPLYREQLGKFLFLVNGTGTEIIDPETKMNVPGFHMTIFHDGWLRAVISPFEGIILTGTRELVDLEKVIIDLLERNIKKLKLYLN